MKRKPEHIEGLLLGVLTGGNHLAHVLLRHHVDPATVDLSVDYLGPELRDVWIAWRSIMDLAEHLGIPEEKQNTKSEPDLSNGEE